MKLNDLKDQFEDVGVGIVGMTYDKPEIIKAFDEKWDIDFPVLKDVDRQHVSSDALYRKRITCMYHYMRPP